MLELHFPEFPSLSRLELPTLAVILVTKGQQPFYCRGHCWLERDAEGSYVSLLLSSLSPVLPSDWGPTTTPGLPLMLPWNLTEATPTKSQRFHKLLCLRVEVNFRNSRLQQLDQPRFQQAPTYPPAPYWFTCARDFSLILFGSCVLQAHPPLDRVYFLFLNTWWSFCVPT